MADNFIQIKPNRLQVTLEKVEACPVCRYRISKPYLICKDHSVSGEEFTLVQCASCNFVYTNPRPNEKQIGKYYQSANYISHTDTNKGIINKVYHLVRKKTVADKVKLVNRLHEKGKLLDIGCGTGVFLEHCKKQGWQTKGIEPDEGARTIAHNRLNVPIEKDFLTSYSNEKFDIITLWHVLEHIHELNKTVEKIVSMMTTDAKVVIAVPNIGSYDAQLYKNYWAAYDIPKHLYHFTKKTLELLMSNYGLRLVEVIPMKFDAYYISLLSTKNKYKQINFLEAITEGYKSNKWAEQNDNNYSSLTYIFSK